MIALVLRDEKLYKDHFGETSSRCITVLLLRQVSMCCKLKNHWKIKQLSLINLCFSVVLHPVMVWLRKLPEVNLLSNILRRLMKRDFVSLRCLLEF
jgi:hypothetical protein